MWYNCLFLFSRFCFFFYNNLSRWAFIDLSIEFSSFQYISASNCWLFFILSRSSFSFFSSFFNLSCHFRITDFSCSHYCLCKRLKVFIFSSCNFLSFSVPLSSESLTIFLLRAFKTWASDFTVSITVLSYYCFCFSSQARLLLIALSQWSHSPLLRLSLSFFFWTSSWILSSCSSLLCSISSLHVYLSSLFFIILWIWSALFLACSIFFKTLCSSVAKS